MIIYILYRRNRFLNKLLEICEEQSISFSQNRLNRNNLIIFNKKEKKVAVSCNHALDVR